MHAMVARDFGDFKCFLISNFLAIFSCLEWAGGVAQASATLIVWDTKARQYLKKLSKLIVPIPLWKSHSLRW
jgi:hypothetical protein